MINENIITDRLLLRSMRHDDAQIVYKLWSDTENNKYMCDPAGSVEEVEMIIEDNTNSDMNLVVATLKNTDVIVGTCWFGVVCDKNEWGFGYNILKEFWSTGYATEIVKGVIDYGISMGIKTFNSSCATENIASGNVLEKNGLKIVDEGSFLQPISNIVYDEYIYKLYV